MRRCPLIVVSLLALFITRDHVVVAQNAADLCPPAYRKDPVTTRRFIEAKKAEMRRRGFPERFLSLLDKEECPKCVQIASDAFHIMVVYNDDENAPTDSKGRRWTHHTFGWDPQSERQVRDELAAGKIKAFYIMNTATRCDCCPEVNDYHTPDMHDDWNKDLEVNMSHVIVYDDPNKLGPLPPDLENPPEGWSHDVPDIVKIQKPAKRYVHVMCPACESLAQQWNHDADVLDYVWGEKMSLLYGISITENAIATRENQISHLEYQQLFASTRTDARQQQIEMLQKVNDAQREDIAYDERRIADYDRSIKEYDAKMAALMKQILDCENTCKTRTTSSTTAAAPTTTPAATPPTVAAVAPAPPNVATPAAKPAIDPVCDPCKAAADNLAAAEKEFETARAQADAAREKFDLMAGVAQSRMGNGNLATGLELANQEIQKALQKQDGARVEVTRRRYELDACLAKCSTATSSNVTTPSTPATPVADAPTSECFGDSCTSEWASCADSGTCKPAETDCGIPGVCSDGPGGEFPLIDLSDDSAWTTSVRVEIDVRIQDKLVDVLDPPQFPQYNQPTFMGKMKYDSDNRTAPVPWRGVVLPASPLPRVSNWLNPLGLLARTLTEHVDRWRGSMAPRPVLTTRDLDMIDRVSGVQAAGLPAGVHVLLADQGGSTGKTLVMSVLNYSGHPVRLSSKPFAVQPIKAQAQQQVQQAFNKLAKSAPMRLDLTAYCVEFLKAPPSTQTLLRLAPANLQQKYAPMSKVLQSAFRVAKANALHPDSNPAAYVDSIKQWSLWTVEQKLNEQRFTEAFIGLTKKNVEAAGQQWSKQADDMVRKASPNRWRDIVTILRGAGVAAPQ